MQANTPSALIIHHSTTKDGRTLSWQAVRRIHGEKGWRDPAGSGETIGYHIGFEWYAHHSGLYEGQWQCLLGRPFTSPGAHCYQKGMNRKSLGVLFMGDFDSLVPSDSLLIFAAWRLVPICLAHGIPIDADHILPHSLFATYKTCPGRRFRLSDLIAIMQAIGDSNE